MARLTDIIKVLADHRVDAQATVAMMARNLREAGRLSQAGRGHAAARASYLDAARLLIACAATDRPAAAVDAEATFSGMVFSDVLVTGDGREWLSQETEPTLDAALASMLGAIGNGEVDQYQRAKADEAAYPVVLPALLELHVHRDGSGAALRFCECRYTFQHPLMAAAVAATTYDETTQIMRQFEAETYRFRSGKHLRAEIDASLLRAVAATIEGKRK